MEKNDERKPRSRKRNKDEVIPVLETPDPSEGDAETRELLAAADQAESDELREQRNR